MKATPMKATQTIGEFNKDNNGASLIFVLAAMMLLFAVGTSVLVAASNTVGYLKQQKEHSQVMILDESVHKSIMYSLQADPFDPSDEEKLLPRLSWQLVMALYEAKDDAFSADGLGVISLEAVIDTDGAPLDLMDADTDRDIYVNSISLSFPRQEVIIIPAVPAIFEDIYGIPGEDDEEGDEEDDEEDEEEEEDEEGEIEWIERKLLYPRIPKEALVNATMVVSVEIVVKGKTGGRTWERTVTSRATYEYMGGFLSDDPDGELFEVYEEWICENTGPEDVDMEGIFGLDIAEIPDLPAARLEFLSFPDFPAFPDEITMLFTPDGYGEWRLIKYENAY